MRKTVIFTDLDGTLLDEVTYSCREALPALSSIAANGVPLVMCSSKTRAELVACRSRLDNNHPFISENGGGIFIPQEYFQPPVCAEEVHGYLLIRLGIPYAEIRTRFEQLRDQLHAKVRGFADMTISEVAALTGLSEDEAILARQRDFDEAFVFDGAPDQDFLQAIEASGLHWTQGRIFHIMGNHDKGRAVSLLMSLYRRQHGNITSIGLGDSLNDLPMLLAVDRPVLVRHSDGSYDARINIPGMLKTQLPGPAGWNEAMQKMLVPQPDEAATFLPEQKIMAEIFNAAVAAVDPCNAVLNSVRVEDNRLIVTEKTYDLAAFERLVVVGAGKATARMALAVESLLGNRISAGLIVVKEGHSVPLSFVEQIEASHPVPNETGQVGTQRILQLMRDADDKTLVICLLSGGASALLVAPVEDVTLHDKQETTRLLLNAGASISELNAVRKHLSAVKGGRLAEASYPAQLVTLILSDVIGDPLDVIASGPTAADNSTFFDAWSMIVKFGLQNTLPSRVVDHLRRGIAGKERETVKANDVCLDKTDNVIIASIRQALSAAKDKAHRLGLDSITISDALQGEARDAAHFLAQTALSELALMKPGEQRCLLCGGETTVTVHGTGKGGRNQELALAFALEIDGVSGLSLLSAGTDGGDGPTDAAGAFVDGNTVALARSLGIDPLRHLDQNDSYAFFQQFDAASGMQYHFKTGPTGTNVMDIQFVLLRKSV